MNHDTAHAQVEDVRRAQLAASRPPSPRGVSALSALSALSADAGVALVAQGDAGSEHLAFLIAGVLLLAAAHVLPTAVRRRRGLHGYRGWTRTEDTTLLLCAVTLVVCGSSATRELSWIFTGLGVLSAAAWYATLRGVLVAGGRPHVS